MMTRNTLESTQLQSSGGALYLCESNRRGRASQPAKQEERKRGGAQYSTVVVQSTYSQAWGGGKVSHRVILFRSILPMHRLHNTHSLSLPQLQHRIHLRLVKTIAALLLHNKIFIYLNSNQVFLLHFADDKYYQIRVIIYALVFVEEFRMYIIVQAEQSFNDIYRSCLVISQGEIICSQVGGIINASRELLAALISANFESDVARRNDKMDVENFLSLYMHL